MPRFFISYRRADTAQIVGRIHEKVAAYFGADSVYLDIDSIPAGVEFREHIKQFICSSDALLAIIGPRWVDCLHQDASGGSVDHLVMEIELALTQGIPVLPVLVGAASMPRRDQLPAVITELSLRNAFLLDVGHDFNSHIDRLLNHLDSIRIARSLSVQALSDYRLIHDACQAVITFLQADWRETGDPPGVFLEFKVYGTPEFERPMEAGISLFLYRIVQDSTSLIEIRFILTAWSRDISLQHLIVGWVIDRLRRNPVVPAEIVQIAGWRAIPPGITLRIYPSTEDAREVWSSVTRDPYQISAGYILRAAY